MVHPPAVSVHAAHIHAARLFTIPPPTTTAPARSTSTVAHDLRLGKLSVASLVVWGESDRIVDLEYGRRYAASMPGSLFKPVSGAGHFPQIEPVEEVIALLTALAPAKSSA